MLASSPRSRPPGVAMRGSVSRRCRARSAPPMPRRLRSHRIVSDGVRLDSSVVCVIAVVTPSTLETCAAMESSHDIHRFHSALWSLFTHISTADRKSTRLNSSHVSISYAVFCLKKKKKNKKHIHYQFIYI